MLHPVNLPVQIAGLHPVKIDQVKTSDAGTRQHYSHMGAQTAEAGNGGTGIPEFPVYGEGMAFYKNFLDFVFGQDRMSFFKISRLLQS